MSGPDFIWANVAVWGNGEPLAGEWNHRDVGSDEDTAYVRRDPATLAALPEVQALIEAERERCISRVRDNWVAGAKTTLGEVLAAIRALGGDA